MSHTPQTALAAFATHCRRLPLDRRPTVWCRYIDVWQTPQGEIGVANPADVAHTCFALLAPWAMIPTFADAWLVVDDLATFEVTNLKVNARGMFNPHWSVPYTMRDDGTLDLGEPVAQTAPDSIGSSIGSAKVVRMAQVGWTRGYDIEAMVPMVEGLLGG